MLQWEEINTISCSVMHSLSLQGKMGIPLVFLFKEKLLIVKLGCQKKETLNKAVFLASAYCTKAYNNNLWLSSKSL